MSQREYRRNRTIGTMLRDMDAKQSDGVVAQHPTTEEARSAQQLIRRLSDEHKTHDEYCKRFARLRELEDQCREYPDLQARLEAKRAAVLAEYDEWSTRFYGPALCPLCQPTLLETTSRLRLRQC